MTEYIMLHTIVIQCSSSFIVISKVTEAKLFEDPNIKVKECSKAKFCSI